MAESLREVYTSRGARAAVALKKVVNIASSSTTSLDADDAFLISITENTSRGQRITRPRAQTYISDAAFAGVQHPPKILKMQEAGDF